MTRSEARAMLVELCETASEPALTESQVDRIADYAADRSSGTVPSASSSTYTYDLLVYRAAAFGWTLKMGRASSLIDFDDKQQRYKRSQYLQHCKEMVARYTALAGGAASGGLSGGGARVGLLESPDTGKLSVS